MLFFLITYMIVNAGILHLAHKANPKPPNVGQVILISLFGLPLFIIAVLMMEKKS